MSQLEELATPFPSQFVKTRQAPGGRSADYVDHSVVTQRLLYVLGPFSTRVDHVFRDNGQVEVVGTLIVTIDGENVEVAEGGEGSDLKKAMSDFIKRAAMRIGCGLHLWSQDGYVLDSWLKSKAESNGKKAVDEVKEQI